MKFTNFRICFIQCPIKFSDPVKNISQLLSHLSKVVVKQPDIVFFPEICLGSSLSKKWQNDYLTAYKILRDKLSEISTEHKIDFFYSGYDHSSNQKITNTAHYISQNKILQYSKIHLFCFEGEQKIYDPGSDVTVWQTRFGKVAPLICYDIRFPELLRQATFDGAKMAWVCAQWPKSRRDHWFKLLQARAIENQMYVIACNRTGSKNHLEFSGDSCVISPWGDVSYEAHRKIASDVVTIDLQLETDIRTKYPFLLDAKRSGFRFDPSKNFTKRRS